MASGYGPVFPADTNPSLTGAKAPGRTTPTTEIVSAMHDTHHGVLEPLPVARDKKRDQGGDPIKSGGTIQSGQITSGGVGDPGPGY